MLRVHRYFAELYPRRCLDQSLSFCIDPQILIHQIPGGMISNFRSQLSQQNALDKLELALTEVTRVREDLGWPPLVTPTSQIVGTQAVMNIIAGERYKIIPNEVKLYVKGMYGRPPAPMSPELMKMILGDDKPVLHRPADDIPPMLPHATEGVDPKLIVAEEDVISYCILPEPALEYFKWRALPEATRPATPADLEVKKALAATTAPKPAGAPTEGGSAAATMLSAGDYEGLKAVLAVVRETGLDEITIRKGEVQVTLRAGGEGGASDAPRDLTTKTTTPKKEKSAPSPVAVAAKQVEVLPAKTINAPLVGTFYSTSGPGKPPFVKPGDAVKAGTTVCVVEAMKLFNEIKVPKDCTIIKVLVGDADGVIKNQPLVAIE